MTEQVLSLADQFAARLAARWEELLNTPAPPLTGVRPVKQQRPPVCAWLRHRAGEQLTETEETSLREWGWYGSPSITIPRNAVSPITRAAEVDDTVPKTIADRVVEEIDTFASVRQVCTVMTTQRMDRLGIPILDDRANTAALVTSTIDLSTTPAPAITSLTLDCKTLSSKPVVVDRKLLRDTAFDLEGYIIRALGARIGRKLNDLLTDGSGSSGEPYGVLTAAPALKTTASSSAFTWKEVHDLTMAVDPVYRTNCKFMMHSDIAAALYQTTDDNNRPIIWADPTGQQPIRLFGYPVVFNDDMPSTVSAGEKIILFGDFSRYVLREAAQLTLKTLQETYAQYDSVGFLALYDFDAGLAAAATTKAIGALQVLSTSS